MSTEPTVPAPPAPAELLFQGSLVCQAPRAHLAMMGWTDRRAQPGRRGRLEPWEAPAQPCLAPLGWMECQDLLGPLAPPQPPVR